MHIASTIMTWTHECHFFYFIFIFLLIYLFIIHFYFHHFFYFAGCCIKPIYRAFYYHRLAVLLVSAAVGHACLSARAHMCILGSACGSGMHTRMRAHMYTHLYSCMYAWLYTCLCTCLRTCPYIYLCTHLSKEMSILDTCLTYTPPLSPLRLSV